MEIIIRIILIIIVIIIIISIIFVFLPSPDRKYSVVINSIKALTLATLLYYDDNNHYPLESEWKDALLQYIADKDSIPNDPWGHSYVYKIPGPNKLPFEIYCLGADGKKGGKGKNKDIYSWEINNSYDIN